jgi:hypothetical protein
MRSSCQLVDATRVHHAGVMLLPGLMARRSVRRAWKFVAVTKAAELHTAGTRSRS